MEPNLLIWNTTTSLDICVEVEAKAFNVQSAKLVFIFQGRRQRTKTKNALRVGMSLAYNIRIC